MWFSSVESVLGDAVLVLVGLLTVLRGTRTGTGAARIPTAALIGGATATALFTGHAWVVAAVHRERGPATLDGPVLAWFLGHRSGSATTAMLAASAVGDSPATTVAVLAVAALMCWRGHRTTAAVVALAALVAPLLTGGFKRLYGRARPPVTDHLTAVGDSALPSGHALNSVVLAGVLVAAALLHLRRTWVRAVAVGAGTVVVLAVGVSRLYLGVHWFTDVIAGWLLGGAWVAVCATAMSVLSGRRSALTRLRTGSRRGPTPLGQPGAT